MKIMRLITICSALLIFSISSFAGNHDNELIYAMLLDDKHACENGLPIVVMAPNLIESHHFMSALFFLKEGDRYVQNSLRYLDDLDGGGGGFFICLDERSLEYASLVLNYGYDQCRGFIYSFRVEKFDEVLSKEKVLMQSPASYLTSEQSEKISKCGSN